MVFHSPNMFCRYVTYHDDVVIDIITVVIYQNEARSPDLSGVILTHYEGLIVISLV